MSEADDAEEETARAPRANVLLGAQISGFGGGARTRHRVRDLSSGGARVDNAGSLRIGTTVLVSVGVLEEVGATVVWVKGDMAGLRFAEAIDPDAARSKTIISAGALASKGTEDAKSQSVGAGWVAGLDNPYRK